MTVTILDFHAEWCGPCKTQDPILEEVEAESEDVVIEKVNVDNEKERANEYQVRSIPTVVVLDDDDEQSDRFVGVTQKDTLLSAIDAAR